MVSWFFFKPEFKNFRVLENPFNSCREQYKCCFKSPLAQAAVEKALEKFSCIEQWKKKVEYFKKPLRRDFFAEMQMMKICVGF